MIFFYFGFRKLRVRYTFSLHKLNTSFIQNSRFCSTNRLPSVVYYRLILVCHEPDGRRAPDPSSVLVTLLVSMAVSPSKQCIFPWLANVVYLSPLFLVLCSLDFLFGSRTYWQ